MKKSIVLFLALIIFTGCETNNEIKDDDLPEGISLISSSDYGNTYSSSNIPFDIPYGDKNVSCVSAELYQGESEHGYYLYAVVSVDVGELSESDLYWMDEEEDFRVGIRIHNENNGLESERLGKLCALKIDNIIHHAFHLGNEYQYSFDNSELSLFFDVDNEKLYDTYMCSTDVNTARNTKDIDEDLYSAMAESLQTRLEFWQNFGNY